MDRQQFDTAFAAARAAGRPVVSLVDLLIPPGTPAAKVAKVAKASKVVWVAEPDGTGGYVMRPRNPRHQPGTRA